MPAFVVAVEGGERHGLGASGVKPRHERRRLREQVAQPNHRDGPAAAPASRSSRLRSRRRGGGGDRAVDEGRGGGRRLAEKSGVDASHRLFAAVAQKLHGDPPDRRCRRRCFLRMRPSSSSSQPAFSPGLLLLLLLVEAPAFGEQQCTLEGRGNRPRLAAAAAAVARGWWAPQREETRLSSAPLARPRMATHSAVSNASRGSSTSRSHATVSARLGDGIRAEAAAAWGGGRAAP